ncbi:MAG: hypothetical protein A3H45_11895 [Ignavibacteria bacterium RIFCSPLOWO2_02_FULL_55_14]|nr:MAG: hypothetical protein A2X68_03540 [Ignavibacteria bacterium GWC2_56_12]OGU69754.1 MAG: hypothetical protein A3H45_11895 [Ignavibacteria bacterium RIFCSPLOWO2_02_FULL_55_14]OGU75904.1 MAG: hypothetical protein A3G43_08910 [Ignavibacteria bacterium RIFCSPLOWO2_12_FULL_56_21]HAV23286.1 hypothetical protein [Bacteroidota bacterium]
MGKRVLFVDEDQGRHGSTVSMEYLVRGFRLQGYDVFVLTWKTEPQARAKLEEHATLIDGVWGPVTTITMCVHFVYTDSPFSVRGFLMIVKDVIKFITGLVIVMKTIRSIRPDVVYVNEYSAVQASLAAWFMGVPSVMHIRSLMLKGTFGFRKYALTRLVLACNRKVFAITAREASQLRPGVGDRHKVNVVGEFVPKIGTLDADPDEIRRRFGMSSSAKIVAMLGGIQEIKGSIDFLRAARFVAARSPNVKFVIAGKDFSNGNSKVREYYSECMKVVDDLRTGDLIRMLGNISNPLDLISVSDIVVSPSSQSHFSRPVVEAWAHAKPVVAARTEHMADLIAHDVDGLLYAVRDSEECGKAILRLLQDERLCRKLGEAGKKKSFVGFDAERNTRKIVDACTMLLLT